MRNFVIALALFLTGCETLPKDLEKQPLNGLSAKTLEAGKCGLYVWTADAAKTFTLFASANEISYFSQSETLSLSEINPTTPPATERDFIDVEGDNLKLILLSPEQIDGGIRYKAGRLTSLSDDGWERVVPIVGFYACKPVL